MTLRIPDLIAGLALVATACGSGDETVGSSPSCPQGADEVVIQVTVAGGFVPVDVALGNVPIATVMGDGTVLTPAPVLAIYPGPAIAALQSVKIGAAQVDRLVAEADRLGLLAGPVDFGRPPVADAPDTTVTIEANGRSFAHSANALGIADEGPGLTDAQVANRRALSELVDAVNALPPGEELWAPSEVAVVVVGPYTPEPEIPQTPAPWPLAAAPATAGNWPCTLVEGADVPVLLGALQQANARTPWVFGGSQWSVSFRPVVPGQPGCP
jgi:hypothetical protein